MRRPPARPDRVAAGALADVTFTVNGTEVTVAVPPRMHLADALRERLGLTGTHLGCEHGVCGMCTVLVDGDAARACLLLAVQCDRAEIVTVEGLGTADAQHPLQRALSHHHGLQCGFCTPGMLMSGYDLLSNDPAPDPDALPELMSGVLCRCTGYRGILAAVADVAAAHPDGVPPPGNRRSRTLVGRAAAPSPGAAGGHPAGDNPGDHPGGGSCATGAPDPDGGTVPETVAEPTGEPSATVSVTREIAAPLAAVWPVLADTERLVACLPGARLVETLPGDRYRGTATVGLGPVRLSFAGLAQVVERDARGHRMRLLAQGSDAGGSATRAVITLVAEEARDGGTVLHADAALHLTGRVAQFGRALAGDVSRRLFEQFAAAVETSARTGSAPVAPTAAAGPALGALGSALARAGGALLAVVRDALRRVARGPPAPLIPRPAIPAPGTAGRRPADISGRGVRTS